LDQGLDINRGGNIILKGADRVYRDNTVAVLNAAAVYGDIDLFDYLVARGAKASQSNALHHAGRSNNAAAMIPHLINTYHLDVNAHDSCGGLNELVKWDVTQHGSPLNYAVYYRNVPAAEVLLKYGANIGDACAIAIEKKSAPAVKLLLDAGADPSRGLGIAITQGFLEGAQLCLEYGGDIAIGEARDEYHAGFGGPYTGMSSEMRKLLDVWK
jgi:ankyrin repeat protein